MKRWLFGLVLCALVMTVAIQRTLHGRITPMPHPTLRIDPRADAILAGADRVETFRLADFHEAAYRTEAEWDELSKGGMGTINDHEVLRRGVSEGPAFVRRLHTAVLCADDPTPPEPLPSCFDPGVAFRVWKGQAHMDIAVCFTCAGVEAFAKDAHHHVLWQTITGLGAARVPLLALCREAFPEDKILQAKK